MTECFEKVVSFEIKTSLKIKGIRLLSIIKRKTTTHGLEFLIGSIDGKDLQRYTSEILHEAVTLSIL